MQQDSATLIYDLNAMKGTMESYLKKIEQAFKTECFQAWKIVPSSVSLKKSENCWRRSLSAHAQAKTKNA